MSTPRRPTREKAETAAIRALLAILEDENAAPGQKLDAAKILLSAAPKSAAAPAIQVILPDGAEELMG